MESGFRLDTERLYLREMTREDIKEISHMLKDINVMYAWEHGFTDAEVAEWVEKNLSRYERDGISYWAVIRKFDERLIGVCGLLKEEADGEEYTGVGYIFKKDYWHQGYAYESASACKEYAKRVLGIKELTAQIRPANPPSRKVAEKLGMTVKKTFIRNYRGKDMPHLLYAVEL
ncbi:GNAT family N-acetyltransferase [Christensenellaceae bacterium OttesenSCG-928-M15]|nr:GNAT family N-acetyltransferase [Christensenellaceae bacterium OttesenSCG-928-M15]